MSQHNSPITDADEQAYPADALSREIGALEGAETFTARSGPDLDSGDHRDHDWPAEVLMFSWEGVLVGDALTAEVDHVIHKDFDVEDATMDAMLQGADRAIAVLLAKNSHESADQLRTAVDDSRDLERTPHELSDFERLANSSATGACDFRSYLPDQIASWCELFDIGVPTMLAAMSPDQNTAVFEHETSTHGLLVRAADHEWADFRMAVWDASDELRSAVPPTPETTED